MGRYSTGTYPLDRTNDVGVGVQLSSKCSDRDHVLEQNETEKTEQDGESRTQCCVITLITRSLQGCQFLVVRDHVLFLAPMEIPTGDLP